jgi:hypothetical protein
MMMMVLQFLGVKKKMREHDGKLYSGTGVTIDINSAAQLIDMMVGDAQVNDLIANHDDKYARL